MGLTMKVRRANAALLEEATSDELREMLRYGAEGVLDLDKAWDGIAWCISEERRERAYMLPDPSDPETQAVYGVDGEDGELLFRHTPELVADIAAAIEPLAEADLRKNFEPEKMLAAEVYPGIWDEGDEAFKYILENFRQLRALYVEAAKAGDGVAFCID